MPVLVANGRLNTTPGSLVLVRDPRLARPWRISDKGVRFLAIAESGVMNGKYRGMEVREGFILEVYDDGSGYPTAGLGYKVKPSDGLKIGDKITIEQAKGFFMSHLKELEAHMNRQIKVPLFQHEYDALVSFAYNIGGGAFQSSSVLKALNSGRYEDVSSCLKEWNQARDPRTQQTKISQGLVTRRQRESVLFDSGEY
ncbi:MAG: lysozyme [Limnohabitans sp.]